MTCRDAQRSAGVAADTVLPTSGTALQEVYLQGCCRMLDHDSSPLRATVHFGNTPRELLLFILQLGLAPT